MKSRKMNGDVLEILNENSQTLLTIKERMDGDVLEFVLSGELKNDVAHELEDEILAALSVCSKFRLDFKGITYIASLSLSSLLSIQQMIDERENAELRIVNVNDEVFDIFKDAGFDDLMLIEKAS